jgi:NSS family neurotransmitter:Na+ symporter
VAERIPQWRSNVGFLLAAIGSAIGLGNIWRFPYVAYENGGGAFLLPYFTALITAGIPILMLEIALGNRERGSAPKAFALARPRWEWLGWWSVTLILFGIQLYYVVIISWCANYIILAVTQAWGNDPDNYFFNVFLGVSDGVWDIRGVNPCIVAAVAVIWFICWLITSRGIQRGIERAVKIMMPVLFLVTVIIVFWALSLDGAGDGVASYTTPDFSKITDIKVWISAYGQIFFSLSLGFGIMIAYSAYLPRDTNVLKNSLIIGFSNSTYEVFAGFGVFSVLGYMALKQNKEIQEVVAESLGLAFVAYPQAISLLPFGTVFGVLFFLLLTIAGISSAISIIEAFASAVRDKFEVPRKRTINFICLAGFTGSMLFATRAGLHWLDIVDHYLNSYGLVTIGVFEAIVIGWLYKTERLKDHILDNLGPAETRPAIFSFILKAWLLCIRFVTPVVLSVAIIYSLIDELAAPYEGHPISALLILGVGWLLVTHLAAFGISLAPWSRPLRSASSNHHDDD